MREIKFRGKQVDGSWAFGSLVITTIGNTKTWIVESARGNGGWFNVMGKRYVYPKTVGQYTGLSDAEGLPIYEGDIDSYELFQRHITAEIIFDEESASFYFKHKDVAFSFSGGNNTAMKVIGNIHDSPELLKEANNE